MNPILHYELGKPRVPFEFTVNTNNTVAGSTANNQFKIPVLANFSMFVNWGDGTTSNVVTVADATHTYAVVGTYTIKILGNISWLGNAYGDRLKILTVNKWGIFAFPNTFAFKGFSNLTLLTVSDLPKFTLTTLLEAFRDCPAITTINRINEWNLSNITVIQSMFFGCTNFNQDIGAWNVSNITNMTGLFQTATAFNNGGSPNINNWNTGNVTTLNSTFRQCAFNQPIGNWNTSNVTNFGNMFLSNSAFNQNISAWNTSKAIFFSNMFQSCIPFNSYIGNWDTSKVTDMSFMFNATGGQFNNGETTNLGLNPLNWVTTALTTLSNTFRGSKFNQAINTAGGFWDVSNVTSFANLFTDTPFNQPLSGWNVSKGTSFANMFDNADAFNQDISAWQFATTGTINFSAMFLNQQNFNVGKPVGDATATLNNWNVDRVTTMLQMFFGNKAFNGDISNWKTGNVTTMGSMFNACNTFNKPIPYNSGTGAWDMSKVTAIGSMFQSAVAFNQNIGSWNLIACNSYVTFMTGKTNLTYSATNLDAIYNGWINFELLTTQSISFATVKYTAAGQEGRNLLTRANVNLTITAVTGSTGATSGLVRVTTAAQTLITGNKVFIKGLASVGAIDGLYIVTVLSTTQVDLQGTTKNATAYVSGGTMRTGYGWTVVDGGI